MRLSTKKAQQIVETLLLIAGAIGVLTYFTSVRGPYRETLHKSINMVVDNIYESYRWDISGWGACSNPCGPGTRTRTVNCVDGSGVIVPDSDCVPPKPAVSENCNAGLCTGYNWRIGDWSPCLPNCGAVRAQSRAVQCVRFSDPGMYTVVGDANCPAPKPAETQACGPEPCSGVWNQACDACPPCGDAVTVPCTVRCMAGLTVVPDSYCASTTRPSTTFDCVGLPQCYYWQFPADPDVGWTTCSLDCGGGTQTRSPLCYDYNNIEVADGECIAYGLPKPPDASRACNPFVCQCGVLPPDRAWCPGADTNVPEAMHGSYYYVGGDSSFCTGSKCEAYCDLTTCAAAGYVCGPLNDGCGGVLDCGSCPPQNDCIVGACVYQPMWVSGGPPICGICGGDPPCVPPYPGPCNTIGVDCEVSCTWTTTQCAPSGPGWLVETATCM